MAEMTLKRTRRGWAVSGGQPYYLFEGTKKAAQAFIDSAAEARAMLAQAEAEKVDRDGARLADRGIGPVDYRDLRPGDLQATGPDAPLREVTEARHLDSGASVVHHKRSAVDRACGDLGLILWTPRMQAYGLIRHGSEG